MKKQKRRKATSPRFRQILRPRIYREQDIAPSQVKVNIHIRLDADIVGYFKEKANQEGSKYQTLINQFLREKIFKQRNLEDRVDHIEQQLGIH
jgi:uncharacterized protein (DUF4415 family)